MKLGDAAADEQPDRMGAIRRLLETGKLLLASEGSTGGDLAASQHDPSPTTKLGDVIGFDSDGEPVQAVVPVNGGYCRRCGRALKDPKWIVQGIGKTCIKKEAGDKQTRFLDARGGPVALSADLTIEGMTLPDGREVRVIDDFDVTHASIAGLDA
jgi:hypothetical protein